MTYDGEIRLKAVVDKSGVVDLEADLGEVEKKAGDAEKAVQDIKLDDSTEKSAKRAAGGVQDLARETRKATEETQRLNQAMQDTERHRNTKIHMNNGQVFDWGGNLVEDASRNTDEMEAAQERLSAAAKQTEQAMRSMAEETQKVNEASQGLGDNAADGIEQQLTPTRNMIAFIKKSFQDIPEMFGMLKEKVSSVLQQSGAGLGEADMTSFQKTEKDWDNLSEKAAHYKGILEELDRKGKGFGDADYDEAYVQWQRAEQAIKDYKAQLINTGQKQLDLKRGIQQVGELLRSHHLTGTMVWWDVEDKDVLRPLGAAKLTESIRVAQEVITAAGYGFGLYVGLYVYKERWFDFNAFAGTRLWIARYYRGYRTMRFDDEPDQKFKPDVDGDISGWQYTSCGEIQGIKGDVDLDIAYEDPMLWSQPAVEPGVIYTVSVADVWTKELAEIARQQFAARGIVGAVHKVIILE